MKINRFTSHQHDAIGVACDELQSEPTAHWRPRLHYYTTTTTTTAATAATSCSVTCTNGSTNGGTTAEVREAAGNAEQLQPHAVLRRFPFDGGVGSTTVQLRSCRCPFRRDHHSNLRIGC